MACLRQAEHTRVQRQTCVHGSKRRFPSDSPHRRHWADFTPIATVLTPQPDRGNSSAEPITGLGEPPAFALTGTVSDRVVALDQGDLGGDRLTERVGSGRGRARGSLGQARWRRQRCAGKPAAPDGSQQKHRAPRRSAGYRLPETLLRPLREQRTMTPPAPFDVEPTRQTRTQGTTT